MIEYIKKRDVIDLIEKVIPVDKEDITQSDIDEILTDIEHMEPENVREYTKGEWTRTEGDLVGVYDCSLCGSRAFRDYSFCPSCGAEMSSGDV